jgi:hypothetical protein
MHAFPQDSLWCVKILAEIWNNSLVVLVGLLLILAAIAEEVLLVVSVYLVSCFFSSAI